MNPGFPGWKYSHIKWLQIIFRLYTVAFHPKSGLRVFKLTLGSLQGAPIKRDAPFPEPLVYLFITLCYITLYYISLIHQFTLWLRM